LTTAISPTQLLEGDAIYDGIAGLLYRGQKETAISTIITRLGGHLPLSDPRYAEIQRQKRVFHQAVRKSVAYSDDCIRQLITAADKIRHILDD